MTSVPHVEPPPRRNPGRRLSTFFVRHEWARLGGLLAAPLGWMLVIYLGSLFVLFLAAFWSIGGILGTEIVHTWTLDNFRELVDEPVYRDVAVRTISMAIYVTVADAVLAFPLAYYMARVATPRSRNILVVAVLMPMLASYLVKAYIWRTMLGQQGIINWLLSPFGLEIQGKSTFGLWLGVHVPLAAVHDPADLRRARAHPELVARGVGRPRRPLAEDVLEGHGAARLSRRSSPARSSRSRSRSATTSSRR